MANEIEFRKGRGRPRGAGPSNTVQSLDRAFDLLKSLAELDEAPLTEIALKAGAAPSTAHRLLTTLQQHGVVAFDERSQKWMIGVEAFRIGSSFLRRAKVVDVGREPMRALMQTTGETANIGSFDEGEVVFLSQVETHQEIRAFFRSGSRGPMHASGIGKALLAYLERRQVEEILHQKGLQRFTPNTLATPQALFEDLERVRARGWSIDDQERAVGMRCIAAPIFNLHGEAVAGISISGPTVRVSDEKISEYGPQIRGAAARVTQALGGEAPG